MKEVSCSKIYVLEKKQTALITQPAP